MDNRLKKIEKEYQDLHESNLKKLNERLNTDTTEQKETLFEILSSVTDIRMDLEKGQVSSMEKDSKFEDAVKKMGESVADKVKKIEESVKKMIEVNEKKKVNYFSDILSIPTPNPMHTSTPIIQTNNVSMHFTNEILRNIPRLQRRRRRSLVDEEDAAIFWQETLAMSQLSQDTIEP